MIVHKSVKFKIKFRKFRIYLFLEINPFGETPDRRGNIR
jgi:hypothetical protein